MAFSVLQVCCLLCIVQCVTNRSIHPCWFIARSGGTTVCPNLLEFCVLIALVKTSH